MSTDREPPKFMRMPTSRGVQRDIDEEMRFHLDTRIEALVREGRSRADAERLALAEFGDVSAARRQLATIDRNRDRRVEWRESLASVAQDVKLGLRSLRRRPGFTLATLLTLALGIGGNAAIFSVVYAVLLKPLPYTQPERLTHLYEIYKSEVDSRSEASYPDYLDWRARNHSFADMAGYHGGAFLLGGDAAKAVPAAKTTWNFFDVLGVKPAIGRTFARGEDDVGAARVVVLSYAFWQEQFGGDRTVVGRSVSLDGSPATIIGVLPRDFQFAKQGNAQLWAPIDRNQAMRDRRGMHWLNIVARLRPGVSRADAQRDMSSIMRDLAREYPPSNAGRDAQVLALRDDLVGSVRPLLLVLYGAVGVVLLIACANVANLLLMRGTDRQREVAVRVALGAGRWRIVRQSLTESVLLSVAGAAVGLGLAQLGVHGLVSKIPAATRARMPALAAAGVDTNVIAYSALLAVVAAVVFGLLPALRTSRASAQDVLRNGGRGSSRTGTLRNTLVVAEIALTLMLLCGASLFGRSLSRLLSVQLGFQPEHVTTAGILLPPTGYPDTPAQTAAFVRIESAVRALPGVSDVGFTTKLPLDFGNSTGFEIAGRAPSPPGKNPSASYRDVAGDYFKTLGISLLGGREFDAHDVAGAPLVGMVNHAFAAAYFDGKSPVGESLLFGKDSVRIVGEVADVPIGNLDDKIPPTLYMHEPQNGDNYMAMVVRGGATTSQLSLALDKLVGAQARGAAIVNIAPMDQLITNSSSVFLRRFPLMLVGVFAGTALLLAIVGIYGVVSYSVAQRSREMGIRMALGAQPRALVAMVVREGGWIAVTGVAIGIAATLVATRFVATMLFGIAPTDPSTYAEVSLVLGAVVLVSMLIPARRASRVDPAVTLRGE